MNKISSNNNSIDILVLTLVLGMIQNLSNKFKITIFTPNTQICTIARNTLRFHLGSKVWIEVHII